METTIDGRQFATPRGWEDLSRMMEVYERLNKNITKEVVGQYIQHDRISVEFAEYYELYQKYQQDYQIAEILKGKPSEAMVKKVSHAPFDERVSVVNLLFSGVRQAVREVVLQEEVLEKVFEILKLLKEPQEGGKLLERLGDYVDNLRMEREQKQKEGLLERREDRTIRKALELLENYRLLLKKECGESWEEAFDILKSAFGETRGEWEEAWDQAAASLECAFDFMEAAFYNTQEMVIFVSGTFIKLTSCGFTCSLFQNNSCIPCMAVLPVSWINIIILSGDLLPVTIFISPQSSQGNPGRIPCLSGHKREFLSFNIFQIPCPAVIITFFTSFIIPP